MNEIELILNPLLKEVGFSKKGKTWLKKYEEVICKIQITKNIFKKRQSYLDWKISIIQLNPKLSHEYVWHAHGGTYSSNIQDKVELEKCLNEGYSIVSERPRLELLEEICKNKYIPFILSLQTIAGIKRAYEVGELRAVAVRTDLKFFLERIS